MLYLLDTNIISHIMRDPNGSAAQAMRARLQALGPCQLATSTVVQCELLFGLQKRPSPRMRGQYEIAMRPLLLLALDESVAPVYATLRSHLERAGTPIGPNDTLIAAHAMALGATLVSADAEFARVPGLKLENWLN